MFFRSRPAFVSSARQAPKGRDEIAPAKSFYPAQSYPQQYLAEYPTGYYGPKGTGVSYPIGLDVEVVQ